MHEERGGVRMRGGKLGGEAEVGLRGGGGERWGGGAGCVRSRGVTRVAAIFGGGGGHFEVWGGTRDAPPPSFPCTLWRVSGWGGGAALPVCPETAGVSQAPPPPAP